MKRKRSRTPSRVAIRKARMADIEPIFALITLFAGQGRMLPRSRADLYEALRDFVVADLRGRIIGCGALTIEWDNLAEIKSLAVARRHQRRGIGRRLVKACLAEARRLGIGQVFALTSSPRFFDRTGFERVARETLPHKVWSDCVNCPKFPDCDETAVAIQVHRRAKAK
jgi:amino-acid N-acetyltransferase